MESMDLSFWKDLTAEEFYRKVASDENRGAVIDVMKTLTADAVWTNPIIEAVKAGRIETRCFVSWLARELQPKNYLEVGVRRGFSMAVTAARSPETEIFGFDLWLTGYAGVSNPGPEFVQSELKKIGYAKKPHFINGDSHKTLPAFFGTGKKSIREHLKSWWSNHKRPNDFNLILIDGDHSLLGAYRDLADTMPHCAIGGAVVFDDILPASLNESENGADPHDWKNLLGVWNAVKQESPNFHYFDFLRDVPGVGIAVRIK